MFSCPEILPSKFQRQATNFLQWQSQVPRGPICEDGEREKVINTSDVLIRKDWRNNVLAADAKQKQIAHLHFVDNTPAVLNTLDLKILCLLRQQKLVENFKRATFRVEFDGLQNHFRGNSSA